MLIRHDDRGVLLIGQPSHAWISGQLARAWGNQRFGPVHPYEEVCLGGEQHDVGMSEWDLAPTRNPDTGLPHSFIEMSLPVHLELWTAAPKRLVAQCRYAALLASMHGTRLYEMRDLTTLEAPAAAAIRTFLAAQRAFQEELLASLRADPRTADVAAPDLVARNSGLIWTWDFMSLAVCLDWAPCTVSDVPTADGATDVTITAAGPPPGPGQIEVDPWPFGAEAVRVRAEGRRLETTYGTDEALATALDHAPWETVEFELRPASALGPRGN